MAAAAPAPIVVTDGRRTSQQQAAVAAAKPGLALPAGRSKHELGLAVDVEGVGWDAYPWITANVRRFALSQPAMPREPWHLEKSGP